MAAELGVRRQEVLSDGFDQGIGRSELVTGFGTCKELWRADIGLDEVRGVYSEVNRSLLKFKGDLQALTVMPSEATRAPKDLASALTPALATPYRISPGI
jgi:hypothetical protein